MGTGPLLRIQGISKTFPGVKALHEVSMEVLHGEVHAVVGENGAGKSTLMHILAGVFQPDEGEIRLEGNRVTIVNQRAAQSLGISIVYQERSLADTLTVAENVFAGRQPMSKTGFVKWDELYRQTKTLLDQLGLDIDPRTTVGELPPAKQQMVEVAKALSLNAKVLLLDEPTSTITEVETQALFDTMRRLKSQGIGIIYISHRLAEVKEIADRVTVLKDGKCIGTVEMKDVSLDQIVEMMVGRELSHEYVPRRVAPGETALEVRHLTSRRFEIEDVSFTLRKGEILALTGLTGAGRTEVACCLFGADPQYSGEVFVKGKRVRITSPREAITEGLGYLPEDRKAQGLFLEMSIQDNIVSASLGAFAKYGIINDRAVSSVAADYVGKLRIVSSSIKQKVVNLSGGNQQKVVLSRWLHVNPDVFIVDEPTRGVDVGAKAEIHNILRDLARKGTAVMVISSDLPEVLALGDRIMVMWDGTITAEFTHTEASEEGIMRAASGLAPNKL